jgi:ABC-type glycerol-3-phosphate transport system substrate-binding protein
MHIRPFEIALIAFFAIAAVGGLFCVKICDAPGKEKEMLYGESVSMWGTFDTDTMETILNDLSRENKALKVVTYTEIEARTFEATLVNAIAEGRSPDIVIIPHNLLVSYRTKLEPISFELIPVRTFRDTYIDGTEIFMLSDGTYGIPFAVDPLVMYWNRDIFSSGGLAQPPKTWETLVSQTIKSLVRTDDELAITQSAIAFGEYVNVNHAKDILSMLLLQAGNDIVVENEQKYSVVLAQGPQDGLSAGDAALTYYTQFALPGRDFYSWNRSKSLDRTEFLNGTLALYFGKGSEKDGLERENANLNFDVAPVPQSSGATVVRDYGDFYAFSIPRASQNQPGAYAVATYLGSPAVSQIIADAFGFAPVQRAQFAVAPTDPFKLVIYNSALIARGWLDPSPKESGVIFQSMIEGVTSGRARMKNVIMDAVHGLESLF